MAGKLSEKRILVVEDDYFIASDIGDALRAEGAVVVGPVGLLKEGLSLAETEPVDAAILDVNLDGPKTYPIADMLLGRSVPCLFVTGYDGWSMPVRYERLPRMTKPFSMPAIVASVSRLLAERHADAS